MLCCLVLAARAMPPGLDIQAVKDSVSLTPPPLLTGAAGELNSIMKKVNSLGSGAPAVTTSASTSVSPFGTNPAVQALDEQMVANHHVSLEPIVPGVGQGKQEPKGMNLDGVQFSWETP